MSFFVFIFRLLVMISATFFGCTYSLIRVLFTPNDPLNFTKSVNLMGKWILSCAGIQVQIENPENLIKDLPAVYIGNHQSALDVAIYGVVSPSQYPMTAIGKKELALIPIFGWWFRKAGGVLLDRKNREKAISQLDEAVRAICEKKTSVGILPEGTRNRKGTGLLPFKKGAFHLAIATQVPILPMIVSPLKRVANFKQKVIRGGVITVRILPPVSTVGMTEGDVDRLLENVRTAMLEEVYKFEKKM